MKLQIIKRAHGGGNFPQSQERLVNANRKGGYFSFNSKCIRELGLTNETRILIAKDEESRNDWYVAFGEKLDGMKLRAQGKPTSGYRAQGKPTSGYRAQYKTAAIEILDSVKAEKSATFLLAAKPIEQDGIEWYRIMTATPIRKI